MADNGLNDIKMTVGGILISWGQMTLDQKREALTAKLTNEIATTSSSWVKARNTGYITLLTYANSWLMERIAVWTK